MEDRTKTEFLNWKEMKNLSSTHLFFIEFVVPPVVHFTPFPPPGPKFLFEFEVSLATSSLFHGLSTGQLLILENLRFDVCRSGFPPGTPTVLHCVLWQGVSCSAGPWRSAHARISGRLWQQQWQKRATRPNQTWEGPPGFRCTAELRKAVFVAQLLEDSAIYQSMLTFCINLKYSCLESQFLQAIALPHVVILHYQLTTTHK